MSDKTSCVCNWRQRRFTKLLGVFLRLRVSHMDEFTISSAFLNWRSNNYYFSLKSTARYLHRFASKSIFP